MTITFQKSVGNLKTDFKHSIFCVDSTEIKTGLYGLKYKMKNLSSQCYPNAVFQDSIFRSLSQKDVLYNMSDYFTYV